MPAAARQNCTFLPWFIALHAFSLAIGANNILALSLKGHDSCLFVLNQPTKIRLFILAFFARRLQCRYGYILSA